MKRPQRKTQLFLRQFGRLRASAGATVQRVLPFESQHLLAVTILVGVICGLVAVAFHLTIRAAERLFIERALHASSGWWAWTLAVPTLGGLVAGALLTWVVPGARGSGIPQVKRAFALETGRVPFREAFGKFWIAALQIGSGASLGREGPTVQICAGATTLIGRLTALPPKSARRLLPVGVAAGIAAAFNAPIAAVTFTIEEIVGSLDHAVLSGVVVAAALAAVIERGVLGVHPIIEVQQVYGLDHASSLVAYAVLGVSGGLISATFTDSLLRLRRWFKQQRTVPEWARPGVGGAVTGILAVATLQWLGTTGVTGGGYETLGKALAGELGLRALLVLCVAKVVSTVASYSSGGAGGIFAPSLFVGAMLGGAVGYLDVMAFGHESRQLGAFALVGMGAVFAGVIRAPITSVLIIFEMTGGYGLVLPLMLANMTSYVIARRLRPTPIYEALLEQDGVTLPRSEPSTVRHESAAQSRRLPIANDSLAFGLTRAIDVAQAAVWVTSESTVVELRELLAATPSGVAVIQATNRAVVLPRAGSDQTGCTCDFATPCEVVSPNATLLDCAPLLLTTNVLLLRSESECDPPLVITRERAQGIIVQRLAWRSGST